MPDHFATSKAVLMSQASVHVLPTLLPRPATDVIYPQAGHWSDAERVFTLVDPVNEQPWACYPLASSADVDQAVQKAARTFDKQTGSDQRLGILSALIVQIETRRDDLALAISREMGAPIDFAREKQVDAALSHLGVILKAATEAPDQLYADPALRDHWLRYEPLGVAALITPWNWPLNQVALKVGAALVSGCTMVLKPSELAPLSAMIFAECMQVAGAGDGMFTLLLGDGTVGAALVAHPAVNVISFTGSSAVGRKIGAQAGADLKPVQLELGGKSANILFADSDVELAVEQGMAHCFRNSGQSCNAATRMLVERPIYEKVVEIARDIALRTELAAPDQPGDHLGPLVSARQFDRVQTCISEALVDGARLVAGGLGRAKGFDVGYFSQPTVFADVIPEMRLFRTEVFGPVLSITAFDTEAEAIALANDSIYGLAGYLQTRDMEKAGRVARQLDAGMIQVNGQSRTAGAPFGGRKSSGFGREAGIWGIRAFQDVKSVSGVE